jgi:5'-nucleotidase, C-terminal domain
VVVVQWIPIVLGKKYKPLWVGGVCHIVAQSFLFNATTANVAIQNGGGCRVLMSAGNSTYGNAYMILSFANTLVTLIMTGDQIKLVLEIFYCTWWQWWCLPLCCWITLVIELFSTLWKSP